MGRLVIVLLALLLLGLALGARPVIEYWDLTCPEGSVVRAVGPAYWALACAPGDLVAGPRTAPTRRYFGLFLTNVDIRLFGADLMAGYWEGPGLHVRLAR